MIGMCTPFKDVEWVCKIQYTKWWDPSPDPAYAGALMHRVALILSLSVFFESDKI